MLVFILDMNTDCTMFFFSFAFKRLKLIYHIVTFLVLQSSRWGRERGREREREMVALLLLCSECYIFLRIFLAVPLIAV